MENKRKTEIAMTELLLLQQDETVDCLTESSYKHIQEVLARELQRHGMSRMPLTLSELKCMVGQCVFVENWGKETILAIKKVEIANRGERYVMCVEGDISIQVSGVDSYNVYRLDGEQE